MEGYALGRLEHVKSQETGRPYVKEHMNELGGKEHVRDPLRRIGGVVYWLHHPVSLYQLLTKPKD